MNAIDYLIEEHNSHRKLLKNIEKETHLFKVFREELILHVNIEEAILYPSLLKVPALEISTRAAWEEHNLIMQLIQEIDQTPSDNEIWLSKIIALKRLVLNHIDDEEAVLFPKIKAMATPEFLTDIGKQMAFQKQSTFSEEIIYPKE